MKNIITTLLIGVTLLLSIPIDTYAFSNNNWMSQIDNNKYISEISIPGTHDSAALYESFPNTAKCQDLTLEEQLNCGIRYIDIRCRSINDSFTIHHGSVYQHLNFDDVINTCANFLSENPTETIIMSVKEEYNSSGSQKTFEEIFNSYLEKNKNIWLLSNRIPTLSECRGKIVLLRRFYSSKEPLGINASNWKDNTTFSIENSANLNIQDNYKVDNNDSKWSKILELYSTANRSNNQSLYINYTSGYKSTLGIPNIKSVSNYINPKLLNYFQQNNSGKFGISAIDFINYDISRQIISTNFN